MGSSMPNLPCARIELSLTSRKNTLAKGECQPSFFFRPIRQWLAAWMSLTLQLVGLRLSQTPARTVRKLGSGPVLDRVALAKAFAAKSIR